MRPFAIFILSKKVIHHKNELTEINVKIWSKICFFTADAQFDFNFIAFNDCCYLRTGKLQ